MKKNLILALTILLIAAVSLSAAPLNLSGRFEGGYTLDVNKDGDVSFGTKREAKKDARIASLTLGDEAELWSLNLRLYENSTTDNSYNWGGALTVDFTKTLAIQNINLPVTLKYTIGRNASTGITSVYKDSNSTYDGETGLNSKYASKVEVGYDKYISVDLIGDPTTKTFGIGANSNPIDGVKVAGGFLYDATSDFGAKGNIINFSADVDIAKLAGLDFSLGASAYTDIILVKDADTAFGVYAEVYGGYEAFDAYVEYRNNNKINGMKAEVGYKVIDDLKLSAAYEVTNFEKIDTTSTISAGIVYTLGGIEYHVEPSYTIGGSFSLPLYVRLNF